MAGVTDQEVQTVRNDALHLTIMIQLWGADIKGDDARRNLSGLIRCKHPAISYDRSARAVAWAIDQLEKE